MFGEGALKIEYLLMLLIAYAMPAYLIWSSGFGWITLAPYLTLPAAVLLLKQIWTETDKRKLNTTLERTAQFMTVFGILLGVGIIWG